MLSDDEALAVMLGLIAGGRTGLVTTTGTASETAAAKIRRVLPERLARRLDAVVGSLAFTAPPGQATAPDTGVLLSVADAVRHHRPISIRYTARDGRRSERAFHPYGLVAHSGRWYVTGADPGIGEDRTFRLDRITDARTLPGSFEPPAGLDPAAARPVCARRHPVPARGGPADPGHDRPDPRPVPRQRRDRGGTAGRGRRRTRRPSAGSWLSCRPSGSTGCPRCLPRSTGRSRSSGRPSSAT